MSLKSLINIGAKLFRGANSSAVKTVGRYASNSFGKTALKVGAGVVGTAAVGVGSVFVSNINTSNYSIDEQSNADAFRSSDPNNRTKEQVYKLIEELCIKYNINPEDAKNAQLLETIAGCSTEELVKKDPEEIEAIIRAFDNALPWKIFSWGNKDIDDIKKIALKANKKFIESQTGVSTWSNTVRDIKHFFGIDTSLKATLEKEGYTITPEGVKSYFDSKMSGAIATKDPEKIKKSYDEILKNFGELLNDTDVPQEKELLMAAVSRMQANKRAFAAKMGLASCANNLEAKQAVARGISKNYEEITCSKDALGEYTSDDDNTTISHISFANMSAEDSMIALGRMSSRRQELEAKMANGEELTEEEARYYNNAQISQYSGAMTGTVCNSSIEDPSIILSTIDRDTANFGIQQQVYSRAAEYAENHQNELPMSTTQFTETVNRATGGNYTKVLNDIKAGIPEVRADKKQSTTQEERKTAASKQNNNANETESCKTGSEKTNVQQQERQSDKTVTNPSERRTQTTSSSTQPTTENKPATTSTTASTTKTSNNTTTRTTTATLPTKKEFSQEKFNKAIKKGISGVIEYQKSNDISEIQLTQEILNSTTASRELQDWALEKFNRMNVALKKLTFPGIHNSENLNKAALLMNPNDLAEMKMNSFYTQERVDRIIEKEEQKA